MDGRERTKFELHCGPSRQYQFPPQLEWIEAKLMPYVSMEKTQETPVDRIIKMAATRLLWLQTAYSIGDDSYLDFTNGQRQYLEWDTCEPDQ